MKIKKIKGKHFKQKSFNGIKSISSKLWTSSENTNFDEQNSDDQNKLLKIVKDITSKGFVRNNYKKNLVDLSDVKISLKGKK